MAESILKARLKGVTAISSQLSSKSPDLLRPSFGFIADGFEITAKRLEFGLVKIATEMNFVDEIGGETGR